MFDNGLPLVTYDRSPLRHQGRNRPILLPALYFLNPWSILSLPDRNLRWLPHFLMLNQSFGRSTVWFSETPVAVLLWEPNPIDDQVSETQSSRSCTMTPSLSTGSILVETQKAKHVTEVVIASQLTNPNNHLA